MWIAFSPDPLPESESGTQRRRRFKAKIVASYSAAIVVDHDREPRPSRTAIFLKYADVQLRMIYLPDRIGSRRFASVNQVESLAIGSCAAMREGRQSAGQSTYDSTHHGIARFSFAKRVCHGNRLPIDGCDRQGRPLKSESFDRVDHTFRGETTGAVITSTFSRERR